MVEKALELVLISFCHQMTAVKIQQFRQSKVGKSDQHTDIRWILQNIFTNVAMQAKLKTLLCVPFNFYLEGELRYSKQKEIYILKYLYQRTLLNKK
jgi:hypothetical protein